MQFFKISSYLLNHLRYTQRETREHRRTGGNVNRRLLAKRIDFLLVLDSHILKTVNNAGALGVSLLVFEHSNEVLGGEVL